MEVEAHRLRARDVDVDMLVFLELDGLDVGRLPLPNGILRTRHWGGYNVPARRDKTGMVDGIRTLSDSLAKNIAPLPIPSVPFFFFPLVSTSETDHV